MKLQADFQYTMQPSILLDFKEQEIHEGSLKSVYKYLATEEITVYATQMIQNGLFNHDMLNSSRYFYILSKKISERRLFLGDVKVLILG